MADQGLKIIIGAEVNQAVQEIKKLDTSLTQLGNSDDLKKVEKSIDSFEKTGKDAFAGVGNAAKQMQTQIKSAGTVTEVNKISAALTTLQTKSKQVSSVKINPVGFDDYAQKAAAAGNATQNLGRVLQDIPFGFVGIANNLNPLLESFQRLKTSTGSTGGALKALGSSLTGAGGIGLALSAVTAAATFASIGMQAWGGKMFGASKEADALKKKSDELKAAIDGAFQSTAQEATRVTALTAILQNETETRKRKLAAIKELKDIQPEIFAGLKLEGDAVIGLDGAYKTYLATLSTVVAAKIKQAQLEQKITELLTLQGATLTSTEKKFANAAKGIRESFQNINPNDNAAKAITQQLKDIDKFGTSAGNSLQNLLTGGARLQIKGTEVVRNQIQQVQDDIEGLTKDLIELSPGIDVKIPGDKKLKEAVVAFARQYDDFRGSVEKIAFQPVPFSLELQPLADASKLALKFSSVKEELDRKLKQFALKESVVPLTIQKLIEVDPNLKFTAKGIEEKIRELSSQFASGVPLKFDISAEAGVTVAVDQERLRQSAEQQINDALQSIRIGALTSIGDAIGDALSGKGVQDAFKSFGNILAAGMRSIGQALIQFGVQSKAIQLALKSLNPYVAIAAGIALIALARGLQNSLSGARETGGSVQGGKKYLVNESGPEIFKPFNAPAQWIPGGKQFFTPEVSGKVFSAAHSKILAAKFNIPKFEAGGLISGPTFGLLGEGAGISSLNPEVVAPLQSLKSLLNTGTPSMNINVTGRIRNRDIRLGQSREGRSQNRTANG